MRSLACVLVLCAVLALCAGPAGAAHVYRDGSEVPGAVKDPDTGYWGIKTSDGKQWFIFRDEESRTAYFFIPGTETSKWEDPRTDEEVQAARDMEDQYEYEDGLDDEAPRSSKSASAGKDDSADDGAWDFPFEFPASLDVIDRTTVFALGGSAALAVVLVAALASIALRKQGDAKPANKKAAPSTPAAKARPAAAGEDDATAARTTGRATRSAVKRAA